MIRRIQENDNKELALIIRRSLEAYGLDRPGTVYTDPTTDNLYKLFQQEGSFYFVAVEGDQILGGCGIYPTEGLPEKHAELVKLYLKEECRGKGLGFQLMDTALKWAKDYGYSHIYLETFAELSSAVKLYEKLGFVGLKGPMGNSGHHACEIWMLKKLISSDQDSQFWIKAWNDGRTNFHQKDFNQQLLRFFPELGPQKGQKVFVPLCGKTKDMLWLQSFGLQVDGIELYERPVKEFFMENNLTDPSVRQEQDFTIYSHSGITIIAGDFFKLNALPYDLIYDRASLVALPKDMRKEYSFMIKKLLRKGGKCLLIVYEYDQSKMDGPPFSVDANEIHELYEDQFTIKLMESKRPPNEGPRLSVLETLKQKVYILEKKV